MYQEKPKKRIGHQHSVLAQIMLIFSLLLTLLLFCFLLFSYQFHYKNYQRESLRTTWIGMQRAQENLDNIIDRQNQQLSAFFRGSSIQYMIGVGGSGDDESYIDGVGELSRTVQESDYLKSAMFFLHGEGQAETPLLKVLTTGEQEALRWNWDSGEEVFFHSDGRLYLRHSFPAAKPLATLVAELDALLIWESVQASMEGVACDLYLYGQDGTPVFAAYQDYPDLTGFTLSAPSVDGGYGVYRWREQPDLYVMRLDSETAPWLLVGTVRTEDIFPGFRTSFMALFPYFFAISALVLFFLYLAVRKIYFPIHSIVGTISREEVRPTPGNELDFIRDSYRRVEDENIRYNQIFASVTEVAVQQQLQALLVDVNADKASLRASLQLVAPEFSGLEKYTVAIIQWEYGQGHEPDYLGRQVVKAQLQQLALEFWRPVYQPVPLELERDGWVIVLGCGSYAAAQIKRDFDLFRQRVEAFCARRHCAAFTILGGITGDVTLLGQAYAHAKEALWNSRYYQHSGELPGESGARRISIEYYTGSLGAYLQEVVEGGDPAPDYAANQVRELFDGAYSPDAKAVCREMMNLVTETLFRLRADPGEPCFARRDAFEQCPDTAAAGEDLRGHALAFMEGALALLRSLRQKEQYRHIQKAQSYLEQHYHDNALSLDGVSRHLGITNTYLSTLFNQYHPAGFVDYLNRYRLEQAKHLLDKTDFTVAKVGLKTGFSSSQSFIRVFKRYCGQTPGQYRNRGGADETE